LHGWSFYKVKWKQNFPQDEQRKKIILKKQVGLFTQPFTAAFITKRALQKTKCTLLIG